MNYFYIKIQIAVYVIYGYMDQLLYNVDFWLNWRYIKKKVLLFVISQRIFLGFGESYKYYYRLEMNINKFFLLI